MLHKDDHIDNSLSAIKRVLSNMSKGKRDAIVQKAKNFRVSDAPTVQEYLEDFENAYESWSTCLNRGFFYSFEDETEIKSISQPQLEVERTFNELYSISFKDIDNRPNIRRYELWVSDFLDNWLSVPDKKTTTAEQNSAVFYIDLPHE